jgi:hypothetical protein
VLIILMSPAFLQISEFLNPNNPNNPLTGNESIRQGLTTTISNLDQSLPPTP